MRAFIGALLLIVSLAVPAFGTKAPTKNPNSQWLTMAKAWAETAIAPLQWFFPASTRQSTLVVTGLPPGATLLVDGKAVPIPTMESPLWIAPGDRQLVVKGPVGKILELATVKIGEGQLFTWPFPRVEQGNDDISREVLGWISMGSGVVAAGGLGITFGLLSKEQMSTARKLSLTPDKEGYKNAVSTGQAFQFVANTGFVLGIVGAGFGTYLLVTDGNDDPQREGGIEFSPTPNGAILHGVW